MNENTDFVRLTEILHKAGDIYSALQLLDWDIHTGMADGSMPSRECQLSTLETMHHELLSSAEYGRLLDRLEKAVRNMDPDSDRARLVRIARRDFLRDSGTPSEWVGKNAIASARAGRLWLEARKKNNFDIFSPALSEMIDLKKEYVSFFKPYKHPLDPLLDLFDEGTDSSDLDRLFSVLKERQGKIIREVLKKTSPDDSFLKQGRYPAASQLALTRRIETRMGFDWKTGRQDRSVHPFTTSIGLYDVRITTKIVKGIPFSSLLSSIHECGHALYEQGVDKKFDRTPLGTEISYAVHESQSRLWENLVARSTEFWSWLYPVLRKEVYPDALKGVSLSKFMAVLNRVEPSAVRTESDELTYNMHIILRYELEKKLLDGTLSVSQLRDAWNSGMYLLTGYEVKNDLEGVLQDVHWSMGEFGYFPSYALGNVLSGIFYESALKAVPEIPKEISKGNFKPLLEFLRKNIHIHGAKFTSHELLKRISGSAELNPEPYLNLLEKRYL